MKNGSRTLLLLLGDIAVLIAAFWIMLHISFFGRLTPQIIHVHVIAFSIIGAVWIIIFFIFNLYDTQVIRPTIPHLRHIFIAFIVAAGLAIIFFYIVPGPGIRPKTNLLIFTGVAITFFILWRRIFYNIFSSHFRRKVAYITSRDKNTLEVNDLIRYIEMYPQSGFIFAGTYLTPEQFFADYHGAMPEVFIVSKDVWRDPLNFKRLYSTGSEVMDLAYAYEDLLGRIPVGAIDEDWFMHNVNSSVNRIYNIEQRFTGLLVSTLILLVTSPIFILAVLCIKLADGGPIFYSQLRVGKGGQTFKLYKFRSMTVDAEKNGAQWSQKGDPRITPIGRILRKLHIDEIPQMINILKGDISLVGPRPERPNFVAELEKEIPFYHLRHIVAPGFTGWAQIKFRYAGNIMDSQKKFEYDLYYLKNRNIFMDFGIVLRTLQIIFTH